MNYKHLHYFWVVAKAGSISRASERLHVTPQTVSGQLSTFEATLGHALFRRVGRRNELTETGRVVLNYADEMFSLGAELESALGTPGGRPLLFRVGVADVVAKSVAYRLVEPALHLGKAPRIVCREGKLATLLADLAVHRLDIVLADSPMPTHLNVRGYSHLLGECGITFLAASAVARELRGKFPRCLHEAPLLLPGEDAAVTAKLSRWLARELIQPRVVGEFDDSAMLAAFGGAGAGIFAAPTTIAAQTRAQHGLVSVGRTMAVKEQFYAISVERRLTHPAVLAISSAARKKLFQPRSRASR